MSSPNPPVACVLANPNGEILSQAHTQTTGKNHAEREAYENWSQNVGDHIAIVSLEPCTHFGRTPPCRDLILEARPKELWIGWKDPNPLIESGNWDTYKSLGIQAKLNPILAKVSYPYLFGFIQRIQRKRPWIWIKSALTTSFHYAPTDSRQVAISSEASRPYLQMLRAKFDAVLVGPNTVSVDEPSLNFRLEESVSAYPAKQMFYEIKDSFFSAGRGLLDDLFQFCSEEILQEHSSNHKKYQPFRIFCISENQTLSDSFLRKQKSLNEEYTSQKVIFIFLGKDANLHPQYAQMAELTEFPIPNFSRREGSVCLEWLAELGINTLLCEAGSFVWEFFHENLMPGDCILTIQGKIEFESGKVFAGMEAGREVSEYQVQEDIWRLREI
ncbi:bifunctional diaminohydroxyphosphoribosylaminopyrimidine deaminase/5-amino-6-(5-phosphoribosylamino)uracil reductase [Leptospira ryugenii]|nr:dihydrofolate reductase family protein [Leptospira ryugenii]